MIRGVEFLVPQTDPDILHQVLGCIDVKSYDWEVSEKGIDTWGYFYDKLRYSGEEFAEKIKEPHCIIASKLLAYPIGETDNDPMYYEDFLRSKCQLVLIMYDRQYTELYCKDEEVSRLFFYNAVRRGFDEVIYKTDENDGRTALRT